MISSFRKQFYLGLLKIIPLFSRKIEKMRRLGIFYYCGLSLAPLENICFVPQLVRF